MENELKRASITKQLTKIILVLGFLLVSLWSFASNSAYAQEKKFTFEFNKTSIKEILGYIEKHSEFIFMYRNDLLDTSRKVSVKIVGQEIEEVLRQLLTGTSIMYEIKGRQIALKKKGVENVNTSEQSNSKKLIQGLIKDDKGDIIIGATIQVKGTNIGTVTDVDGLYHLTVPSSTSVLVISYIGYETQEVVVGNRQNITITLKENVKEMEEVVITAFGIGQKKESMVGSVQQVKPSELKVPSSSLSSSFAGRLSGVIAVQRSGQPGADGTNFWIRGASTFSGATDALIVLDGVEINSVQLNALDPEVIESFSILKDATATALYGTRGANGVMIITTKNGSDLAKPIINFRVEGAVSQLTDVPTMVDGVTYMNLYNEAQTREPATLDVYSSEQIEATENRINPYLYPNVDWYNEMFKKNSFAQRFNFNIRGGSKRMDYFMSASVKHTDGNLKSLSKNFYSYNNNLNIWNYDFVNNLNIKATSTTKVSLGLNASIKEWDGPEKDVASIFSSALMANPVDFPIYFPAESMEDTHIRWGGKSGAPNGSYVNPVADYVSGYSSYSQTTVVANLRINQKLDMFVKGLEFNALISYKNRSYSESLRKGNINQYEINSSDPATSKYTTGIIGTEKSTELKTEGSTTGDRRLYIQATLNYNRKFNKVHDVNAMLLYNQEENNSDPVDLFTSLPRRKQGIAGRLSYAFSHKYLIEANFGYNGSENFPKSKKFGFFPSVALGYNIAEENFWKPLKNILPQFKMRASWGLVGNDQTGAGRFTFLEDLNNAGIAFMTGTGSSGQSKTLSGPTWIRYANPNLTWEVGEKINVGLDTRIFYDLAFSIDFFKEKRTDIFMERASIPAMLGTGATKISANLGEMENKGIDASLDYNKQFNKNWFISFKGTFIYAHNKILKRDEPLNRQYPNVSTIGNPVNTIYGYISDGLIKDQAMLDAYDKTHGFANFPLMPGDIKYKDIADVNGNTDNVINTNDRVAMGYPTVPEIIYGFGPSIKFKNLDFSFFFQGAARTSLMMSGFHPFVGNSNTARRGVLDFVAENCWTTTNPNEFAKYPRLTSKDNLNNNQNSSYWLRDASFLKLKNAEIGYTIKNMRFYISGSNLLTISSFKLWDPEMGGGSGMKYPTQRTINFGFQMTINN